MALKVRHDFYKVDTRIDTTKIYPHQPHGQHADRPGRAAQQGHRRRRTPSPTSRASTRMASSSTARPTRSWTRPSRSASRRTRWCWASTPAGTPSATASIELGYNLTDEQIEAAFDKFKALADKKKEVFDEDIEALVDDQLELSQQVVDAGGPAGDGRLQRDPHGHGHAQGHQRRD